MKGPNPKPASKRRRRTAPVSYGKAQPITVTTAATVDHELGFDAHPMVDRMWEALQTSCESRFYSIADWQRARFELWHCDQVLKGERITAASWAQIQAGLGALLVSPADKRRAGIEVVPSGRDEDADAAVSMMSSYRQKLQSST